MFFHLRFCSRHFLPHNYIFSWTGASHKKPRQFSPFLALISFPSTYLVQGLQGNDFLLVFSIQSIISQRSREHSLGSQLWFCGLIIISLWSFCGLFVFVFFHWLVDFYTYFCKAFITIVSVLEGEFCTRIPEYNIDCWCSRSSPWSSRNGRFNVGQPTLVNLTRSPLLSVDLNLWQNFEWKHYTQCCFPLCPFSSSS